MCSGASGLVAGTGSGLSEMPAGEWILYRLPPMRTSCLFSVLCPLRLGPQALPPLQATLSQEVEGLRGTRDWGLGVAVGTAGAVCWGPRYRLPRAHCLWVSRLVAEAPGAHWLWGPYLTPRGFPKGTFGCFVLTLLRFCQQIFPFAFAHSPPPPSLPQVCLGQATLEQTPVCWSVSDLPPGQSRAAAPGRKQPVHL